MSARDVPNMKRLRSTCPEIPRILPQSENCQMLCRPMPLIDGRTELYLTYEKEVVIKTRAKIRIIKLYM